MVLIYLGISEIFDLIGDPTAEHVRSSRLDISRVTLPSLSIAPYNLT